MQDKNRRSGGYFASQHKKYPKVASAAAKNSSKVNYRAGVNRQQPLIIPKSKFENDRARTYRIFWNRRAFNAHKAGRRLRRRQLAEQHGERQGRRGAHLAGKLFG